MALFEKADCQRESHPGLTEQNVAIQVEDYGFRLVAFHDDHRRLFGLAERLGRIVFQLVDPDGVHI